MPLLPPNLLAKYKTKCSFGLGENLHISPKEAKSFIEKYYEMYPSVHKYMENIKREAYENGYVRTLFNRKRFIDELKSPVYTIRTSGERIALNTPIQGTGADIIKIAMVKIDNELEERGLRSKMLVQVHDELVFEVEAGEEDTLKELVERNMENAVKLDVPLIVDDSFGKNWYEVK